MAKFVTGTIKYRNGVILDTPISIPIGCDFLRIVGTKWMVPIVSGGALIGWNYLIQAAKPTPDSVKVIEVELKNGDTIGVLINDADTVDEIIAPCNDCCGPTPVMDAVTIPPVINEQCPCHDVVAGVNTWTHLFLYPDLTGGFTMDTFASFNGAYATPLPGQPFASYAAVLAAAQANYAAQGVWSNVVISGKTYLKLVTTTTPCAGVHITRRDKSWCMPVVGSNLVDTIVIGGTEVTFPPTVLDATNPQAVLAKIAQFLPGVILFEDGNGDFFYQYTGQQVPSIIKDSVSGTTYGTFGAGLCVA